MASSTDVKPNPTRNPLALRIAGLGILYSVELASCLWLAYLLRFDFGGDPQWPVWRVHFGANVAWIVLMKVVLLLIFGQFAGLLSYFSIPDLRRLLLATGFASLLLVVTWFMTHDSAREPARERALRAPPRSVILGDFIFSLGALAGTRLGFRMIRERYLNPNRSRRPAKRVGIVGAGDAGASLAKDLLAKRGLGLRPVAFFDDDVDKWRSRIHGLPVLGAPERLSQASLNLELDEVIIAMPSASAKRIGEVVKVLQQTRLKFRTVPSLDQLALGKVKISELRPVEIQDLLGRSPVELETENIRHILSGVVVMVTGAGGSIGSELCRQIAEFNPKHLLLVEQSEVQLFQIEQEMIERRAGSIVVPLVADILDSARMRAIFQRYQPAVVFHAAAHKHVPLMELQPGEAVKNNTLGTRALAQTAAEHGVSRFVLISTDKAINPTSVMGATKRMAEIFTQSLHASQNGGTKFMAVRFGNVLGSSGSVIPTFQKQILAGGPVRVTHPEVTRYFMTIPEAVGLVLQSGAQGEGGEIFVLDMGKPIKIVDLARQMIELSGLKPEEDIEIEFTGLRPGEKLYEELNHHGENITPTTHPKIMRFVCQPANLADVNSYLDNFAAELPKMDPLQIKAAIKKFVPEYAPYLN
ncbi:MAG TPA: nucleoside-diphosphate sugar epimerase/dehydratase [Verrucomicrobiae bacterium]|nr:nucleoside-diphosphate sugar epimerase/dehydratase [Verrucomicrobiae bacterium]